MALVGPPPETADTVLRRRGLVPDYALRFAVPPGITGLAQVSEFTDDDTEGIVRRAHFDLFYVDNRSWWVDAQTLGRSFGVVMGRRRRARPVRGAAATPERRSSSSPSRAGGAPN